MTDSATAAKPSISWKDFLESAPPNQQAAVLDAVKYNASGPDPVLRPPLELYCDDESCGKVMFFDAVDSYTQTLDVNKSDIKTLRHLCRHCKKTSKIISVW